LQEGLKKVFLRAITKTQFLILNEASFNHYLTITSLLCNLSQKHGIALSTLKDAGRRLKELGLIDYGNSREWKPVKLTDAGRFVLDILKKGDEDKLFLANLKEVRK